VQPPWPPPVDTSAACNGAPAVLASIAGIDARHLAIDGASLYVVAASRTGDPSKQDIWMVAKSGGAKLRVDDQGPVGGLTTDGTGRFFWTAGAAADDAGTGGGVWEMDPSRASPNPIAVHRPSVGAIALDGCGRGYWVEEGVDTAGAPFGAIVWASRAGGAVTTLQRTSAAQLPRALAFAYLSIYQGPCVQALAWTTFDPSVPGDGGIAKICSLPLPFGAVASLASSTAGLTAEGNILFLSGPSGVMQTTLSAEGLPSATRPFAPASGFVDRILAADSDDIFFVDPSGELLAVRRSGDAGASSVLASRVDPASAFGVDSGCVYWIDAAAGAVMMARW
jgi:hypothetical protein